MFCELSDHKSNVVSSYQSGHHAIVHYCNIYHSDQKAPPILTVLPFLFLQTQYPLVNLTSALLCNTSGVSPDVLKGKAVVVMRGDCDFSQKALVAQSLGATTLLIASNKSLVRHVLLTDELQRDVFLLVF